MIENILVAGVVITAFYFVIRFILKRLAGGNQVSPCQGCSSCGLGSKNQTNGCPNIGVEPNDSVKAPNSRINN